MRAEKCEGEKRRMKSRSKERLVWLILYRTGVFRRGSGVMEESGLV